MGYPEAVTAYSTAQRNRAQVVARLAQLKREAAAAEEWSQLVAADWRTKKEASREVATADSVDLLKYRRICNEAATARRVLTFTRNLVADKNIRVLKMEHNLGGATAALTAATRQMAEYGHVVPLQRRDP